eukprot:764079-Hanusia_phi.AAC.12
MTSKQSNSQVLSSVLSLDPRDNVWRVRGGTLQEEAERDAGGGSDDVTKAFLHRKLQGGGGGGETDALFSSATVFDQRIFVVGGLRPDGGSSSSCLLPTDSVESYSPRDRTWRQEPPLQMSRWAFQFFLDSKNSSRLAPLPLAPLPRSPPPCSSSSPPAFLQVRTLCCRPQRRAACDRRNLRGRGCHEVERRAVVLLVLICWAVP